MTRNDPVGVPSWVVLLTLWPVAQPTSPFAKSSRACRFRTIPDLLTHVGWAALLDSGDSRRATTRREGHTVGVDHNAESPPTETELWCKSLPARQTQGPMWASRRAPISEGALLERGQAQFWVSPSTLYSVCRSNRLPRLKIVSTRVLASAVIHAVAPRRQLGMSTRGVLLGHRSLSARPKTCAPDGEAAATQFSTARRICDATGAVVRS